MKTNTAGGSRHFSVRMPTALHAALVKSAEENGLSLAGYLKFLASRELRQNHKVA